MTTLGFLVPYRPGLLTIVRDSPLKVKTCRISLFSNILFTEPYLQSKSKPQLHTLNLSEILQLETEKCVSSPKALTRFLNLFRLRM